MVLVYIEMGLGLYKAPNSAVNSILGTIHIDKLNNKYMVYGRMDHIYISSIQSLINICYLYGFANLRQL